MSKQTVGLGSVANDGNGDGLRVALDKVNDNFDELYLTLGDGADLTSIILDERADHALTPAAGKAEIWLSNDATQKLMLTDDTGADREVVTATTVTSVAAFTGMLGLNSGAAVDVTTRALLKARISDLDAYSLRSEAGAYTIALNDAIIRMTSGSANTITIPANAATAIAIGTKLEIWQEGAGTTTIAGATGVTLQGNGGSVSAGSCDIQTRYGGATLTKVASDTWNVGGDIGVVA